MTHFFAESLRGVEFFLYIYVEVEQVYIRLGFYRTQKVQLPVNNVSTDCSFEELLGSPGGVTITFIFAFKYCSMQLVSRHAYVQYVHGCMQTSLHACILMIVHA
jgi:hypothetical protein